MLSELQNNLDGENDHLPTQSLEEEIDIDQFGGPYPKLWNIFGLYTKFPNILKPKDKVAVHGISTAWLIEMEVVNCRLFLLVCRIINYDRTA